jgi:hypothetical protein
LMREFWSKINGRLVLDENFAVPDGNHH